MARAPFQVLVFPFRRAQGRLEYALFSRSDSECCATKSLPLGPRAHEKMGLPALPSPALFRYTANKSDSS